MVDPVIAEQLGSAHPLAAHLDDFLTDLANAGKSAHTRRAYRGDLIAFAAHHGEEIAELTAAPVRAYLAEFAELSPARGPWGPGRKSNGYGSDLLLLGFLRRGGSSPLRFVPVRVQAWGLVDVDSVLLR
ncbi:site-specific integrase [Streptosporangium amethystogenes]|uniref:site-specific integrase n=1 Tax=Streptosporangium amethystogenes TaxID=2002 RepID=UPI00379EB61B